MYGPIDPDRQANKETMNDIYLLTLHRYVALIGTHQAVKLALTLFEIDPYN